LTSPAASSASGLGRAWSRSAAGGQRPGSTSVSRVCKSSLTTSSRGRLRSCPSAEKPGGTLASVTAAKEAAGISSAVAFPTENDMRSCVLLGLPVHSGEPAWDQGGAAGCADEVAGLPRRPGRVASGGEAEANVAWPPTRRARNLRSLRERAQAGPERPRSPRGCLQPPLSASRPDPTQKIDPRTELLEGRKR